jgi:hypothetical protein
MARLEWWKSSHNVRGPEEFKVRVFVGPPSCLPDCRGLALFLYQRPQLQFREFLHLVFWLHFYLSFLFISRCKTDNSSLLLLLSRYLSMLLACTKL